MAIDINNFELQDSNLSAGESTTLNFEFSTPVVSFDSTDLLARGVRITDLTTLDNQSWTATVTAVDNYNGQGLIRIRANNYFNSVDGTSGDKFDFDINVDSTLPLTPEILLEDTGSDNIYNIQEVGVDGTITATIVLPKSQNIFETTKPGGTLTVNGIEYSITQEMIDNGFDIKVTPQVEPTQLSAFITDVAGNIGAATTETIPSADLIAPNAPTITIYEDVNNDGVVSYLETAGDPDNQSDIDYTVTLAADAMIGDILTVNGLKITIDQNIIDNGYQGSLEAVDQQQVSVIATVTDIAGNPSEVAQNDKFVDLTIPDADPIFLWHLGYNLSNSEGPSDHRGKSGGKYGDNISYETGIINDFIYIGYDGFDDQGNLIKSCWDGDFERDCGDGDVVWTMETYAGHDVVQIREDQNAYTVAKLGSGDDTYYVQGALDSNLHAAQSNSEARGYIYAETGDDTIVIGGNGDGKVTGWGIDGGRIFTGSGNDNVTVYGEMDDGGIIDLGAGKTEFITQSDIDAANTVDVAGDVNNLTITCNLGEYGSKDFGYVFGGAGDDNVSIGTDVRGISLIDLGDGNNSITVGRDLTHDANIITGSGDDTLSIGDDIQCNATVDLGDGNNSIHIASMLKGDGTLSTGDGIDIVTVEDGMKGNALVELGGGNDSVTLSYMRGNSHINAEEGDDLIVFSGGKLCGTLSGGLGSDTLQLTFDENDSLVSRWSHDTNVTSSDFEGFEVIELNGQNALDICFEDLVQDRDRDGALYVTGNSASKVDMGSTNWNSDNADRASMEDYSGGTWSIVDSQSVEGVTYDVYHHSSASDTLNDVYIEQGIVVI